MKQFDFSMSLPAHKLLQYYQGSVRNVVVTTDDGLRLQLPLEVFRPYVSDAGIYGVFTVTVDDDHKLLRLDKKG